MKVAHVRRPRMIVDDHALPGAGLAVARSRSLTRSCRGRRCRRWRSWLAAQPEIILLDNHPSGAVRGVDVATVRGDAAPGVRVLMLTASEDEADLPPHCAPAPALSAQDRRPRGRPPAPSRVSGRPGHQPEMTGLVLSPRRSSPTASATSARARCLSARRPVAARARDPAPICRGASNKEIARANGDRRKPR